MSGGNSYEIHVTAFPELQMLTISMKGIIHSGACLELYHKVKTALVNLSAGFVMLVDMSHVGELLFETYQLLAKVMDLIYHHGVSRIARVFIHEKKDIGLKIATRFHYGPEVKISYHSTITQALAMLLSKQIQKLEGGPLKICNV